MAGAVYVGPRRRPSTDCTDAGLFKGDGRKRNREEEEMAMKRACVNVSIFRRLCGGASSEVDPTPAHNHLHWSMSISSAALTIDE